MFVADATFEVVKKPDPNDRRVEGIPFRMSLISLENVREVTAVQEGQFATYAQIVGTLTNVLPDWAAFVGQMPGMNWQYHTLQFESREEIEELVASMKR